MSKSGIVVPKGMLKAFDDALNVGERVEDFQDAIEAALLWLSEHPIVPTEAQLFALDNSTTQIDSYERWRELLVAFQRVMFRAPEQEEP